MSPQVLAVAASLLAAAWADAPPLDPAPLTPAPADACDGDVFEHVFAAELKGWRRVGEVRTGPLTGHPALAGLSDLLTRYHAVCGAAATYRDTEGSHRAEVVLIAFDNQLDALGFFSAQRGPEAQRVILTSLAYRDRGGLHAQSGRFYLRVEATGPPTQALQPDHDLAARLEEGLPKVTEPPRIVSFFPRRWLTSLAVAYAPAFLLGDDPPMAFSISRDLPLKRVDIFVADVKTEARALALYTDLLERTLATGRVYEVPRLGQEAFKFRERGCPIMVMRQDEFLSWVCGEPVGDDAEALLRLLGTAIRTSRPLPMPPSIAPTEGD